jgi:hypothetical protein
MQFASLLKKRFKKKATIRPADDGLGYVQLFFELEPYIIRSDWTGIVMMPVTVTRTVRGNTLRRTTDVMIWRYSGGAGYIMSNEFSLTIHKHY